MKTKMKNYVMKTMMACITLGLFFAASQSANAQKLPKDQQTPKIADAKIKAVINYDAADTNLYNSGFVAACSEISITLSYVIDGKTKSVVKKAIGPNKKAKDGECNADFTVPGNFEFTLYASYTPNNTFDAKQSATAKPSETKVISLKLMYNKP